MTNRRVFRIGSSECMLPRPMLRSPWMQKAKLHVREFIAHGQQWQAIRHPSRKSQPWLRVGELLGRSTDVGLLFVADDGQRCFLPMTLDDFPSKTEFESLTPIELVELLERAGSI